MSAFKTKNVFVNPFYQEGVGRRTGIVLNKNVRKHSDGFEVFDDYWSESESENDITINRTHTNAAEKENHGTKPRLKKSSLKSMPSFSPAVTSSEREESKAEPLPQEVSQAVENASALEADLTGSIIKVPPSGLEPSSALLKFKTRQRLSFSAAASSEESQTTEGEGSVGDEGESQESGTSSEGTVKAPSSQSELSQEGDSPTETENEDGETGSEMQSSQATGETSSQEEVNVPDKAEAPSLSQDGEAQRRESKRRSTRGKPTQVNSQDESVRPDSDQDAIGAKEMRSKKSSSQSKDVTGNRKLCEKEGEGEEETGVETRRRKSAGRSHKMTKDDEGEEMQKDTETESRKCTGQSTVSIPNENYPEKDNEKKPEDTRRRKSTRQENKVEKKGEEEKGDEKENVKTRRSSRHANILENVRDNVGKDAKSTRRKGERHSKAPVGKEIEKKEDECRDDQVAKGEGEKVGGDKRDEVRDPATETEEEAGETETGETETGETETETEGGEVVEPEKEKTNIEAESEVKIKDAVSQKKEIVTVPKPDVGEDEDDDTERVFFSLRVSTAVPSLSNLEDEFDVADANPQEFGVMDDAMSKKNKKVERTSGQTVPKGRKKNNIKESQVNDKSEHLKRSTRKPTQKSKLESKKPKGQKDRAMKRGSSIHRDDDPKKSKESPEEATNGFKDRSKPNSGNKKSRGKKSNKQNDRLERSRRTSGSTSQTSSSDTDTGSQPEDTMLDHKTKQRKQGRKKASDHPAEISRTGKKSEKTAGDKTQEKDENGQSGGKPGSSNQVMRWHRSRRSSVHFTTKDMISVSGDISVHQVSSGEDDNANKRKAPPTPAALPADKRNSRKSSKRKSIGSRAKTQDKTADDDIENKVEHLSGQSGSDSTAESEKENADQGRSRRGKKKGSKAKKRKSSLAVSTTSVFGAEEPSGGKKRRVNGREQERAKSASESDGDAIEGNVKDHTLHISVGHQGSHHSEASATSPRDETTNESASDDQQEMRSVRSLSTGSILKVSQDGGTRRQNKKKKYSILFTEKPLQKAYIIKPDEEDGVRRTRRQRVRPLEYWRNERPLYERRKSGGFALAGILSPEQPEKKEFSRSVRAPAKPKGHLPVTPSNISIHTTPPVGVSKVCQPTVNVVNPDSEQEVAIDAVARSKMLVFTGPSGLPAEPDDPITISKALSQKAFSAGVLTVRPFEEKGSQMVRRDTMIFYVVRGKIAMTLHETSQILQSGDFFFVPKGNVYNIKNLRKDEAKLTFFQLKSA